MSEIDRAIEFVKKNIKICEGLEVFRRKNGLCPDTTLEIHQTILKALEEKQQREQGCTGCNYNECDKAGKYLAGKINACYGCRRNPHTSDNFLIDMNPRLEAKP